MVVAFNPGSSGLGSSGKRVKCAMLLGKTKAAVTRGKFYLGKYKERGKPTSKSTVKISP